MDIGCTLFISLFGWFETFDWRENYKRSSWFISLFGWFETRSSPVLKRTDSRSLYPSLVDSKRDFYRELKARGISLYPSLVDSKREDPRHPGRSGPVYIPLWLIRNLIAGRTPPVPARLYPSLVDSKLNWRRNRHEHDESVYIPLGWFETLGSCQTRISARRRFISLFGWFETAHPTGREYVASPCLYPSLVDSKRYLLCEGRRESCLYPSLVDSKQFVSLLMKWLDYVYIPLWLIRNDLIDFINSLEASFISLFGWFETKSQ